MTHLPILMVGCGRMGSALLQNWVEQTAVSYHFHIVKPSASCDVGPGVTTKLDVYASLNDVPEGITPRAVIFAVKPQMLGQVIPAYRERFGSETTYLSIAAGKKLAFYQKHLGDDARVIRTMPNTPSVIGRGTTVLVASPAATDADRELASTLMEAAGITLWLDDETNMDVITAISGSGPAYVFYFMECLMRAGMDHGLDEETARTLVMHLMLGSSELAFLSNETIDALRKNVTSPGGTTEAALSSFMNPSGMLPLVQQAVDAAVRRAGELDSE